MASSDHSKNMCIEKDRRKDLDNGKYMCCDKHNQLRGRRLVHEDELRELFAEDVGHDDERIEFELREFYIACEDGSGFAQPGSHEDESLYDGRFDNEDWYIEATCPTESDSDKVMAKMLTPTQIVCENCGSVYTHRSSLSRHRKKCQGHKVYRRGRPPVSLAERAETPATSTSTKTMLLELKQEVALLRQEVAELRGLNKPVPKPVSKPVPKPVTKSVSKPVSKPVQHCTDFVVLDDEEEEESKEETLDLSFIKQLYTTVDPRKKVCSDEWTQLYQQQETPKDKLSLKKKLGTVVGISDVDLGEERFSFENNVASTVKCSELNLNNPDINPSDLPATDPRNPWHHADPSIAFDYAILLEEKENLKKRYNFLEDAYIKLYIKYHNLRTDMQK